jgi:hypothetical protein
VNDKVTLRLLAFLLGVVWQMVSFPAYSAGVVTTASQAPLMTAMSTGGTVTFGFNGTIYLTNTITVSNSTVLDATGQTVTISGSNAVQIFIVNPNATLVLSNLTLANGLASGSIGTAGCGGAISNAGVLQAVNCVFTNNGALGAAAAYATAGLGGALYNAGSLNLSQCTFATNWAFGGNGSAACPFNSCPDPAGAGGNACGGAIFNSNSAVVLNCSFSNNVCLGGAGGSGFQSEDGFGGAAGSAFGGAIGNAAILSLFDSTFLHNSVLGGQSGNGGPNNTFIPAPGGPAGPAANGNGGALCSLSGNVFIVNSTFVSNSAVGGQGGSGAAGAPAAFSFVVVNGQATASGNGAKGANGVGGGICLLAGTLALTNVTCANNLSISGLGGAGGAGGAGGNGEDAPLGPPGPNGTNGLQGIVQGNTVADAGGSLIVQNSILDCGVGETNVFGPIIDSGNNLNSDATDSLTNSTSRNGVNPQLAPLGYYGGFTATMALLPGSPAIDAGDPASFPATDQRGFPRPFGPAPDIGAFEYSPSAISGNISGLWPSDQAAIFAGPLFTLTTSNGAFALVLSGGSYTVSPGNANYVFSPPSQTVTIGTNGTNLIFQAYRINALNLAPPAKGVLPITYAGSNGQSFRIFASSNLVRWNPISTNVLGANGFMAIAIPTTNSPRQFYRVLSP